MNRAAIMIIVLTAASMAAAQTKPAAQGTPAPASAGQQAAGQTPPQQGKRPPQAKTQPEYDAYNAALKSANSDPAALEKGAADFATKFPDSELRVLLYKAAMHAYQNSNNGDKMLEMGRDVLKIDPDDPEALVSVSEVLAERTRDTDLDKDQRLAEAMTMAKHAVETVDTDLAVPPTTPQEKVDAYKAFYRSSAYSVMGAIAFNQEKYPEAEGYFRQSIAAYPSQPDPIAVLRLALSLDTQEKYPEALKEAEQAVQLTQENTQAGTLARQERSRLAQLTGAGGSAAPPNPNSGAPNQAAPPKQ
jgi:tetratricopeptide (TPR) repeat protein